MSFDIKSATEGSPRTLNYSGPVTSVTLQKHQFLRVLERMQTQARDAPRSDWFFAALSAAIGIGFALVTSEFRDRLWLKAADWQALFLGALAVSVLTLLVQGVRLLVYRMSHKMKTAEELYDDVLAEMAKDQAALDAIDRKHGSIGSPAMKESSSDSVSVVTARYGAGDKWADVLPSVNGMIKNGKLVVEVTNTLALSDPNEGVAKMLEVTYMRGSSGPFVARANEGGLLSLP